MLFNNGQVEFEGAAEALFTASPARKRKDEDQSAVVITEDEWYRHHVDGRSDNMNFEFPNEVVLQARQESDEAMRVHFRKAGQR